VLRASRFVSAVVALALAASPAYAQPRPNAPPPPTIRSELSGEARDAWDRAQTLLRAKDFGAALVQFNRAYELSQNARVLFNVGICEKELHHYARAAERFQKELDQGEGKLSEDEKAELRNAIAIVRKYVSTVTVSSNEPDATLYIDEYDAGKTPFTKPILVDVGPRKLTLKKEGFNEQTVNVDIVAGQPATAEFKLEETVKKGIVHVTATGAPRAVIWMDGTEMGTSPFDGKVLVGPHTFEARAPGYVTATQTTNVGYRQEHTIAMSLSAERHEARVTVDVTQTGAIIEIDGKVVGSQHWEGNLPSGGHQLIVKKHGFEVFTQELSLRDDQVRSVRATLTEKRDSSWIWWTAGTLAVVAGGAVVSYFVFKPNDQQPYTGTLPPGLQSSAFRFR
jgi:hypothetical protein